MRRVLAGLPCSSPAHARWLLALGRASSGSGVVNEFTRWGQSGHRARWWFWYSTDCRRLPPSSRVSPVSLFHPDAKIPRRGQSPLCCSSSDLGSPDRRPRTRHDITRGPRALRLAVSTRRVGQRTQPNPDLGRPAGGGTRRGIRRTPSRHHLTRSKTRPPSTDRACYQVSPSYVMSARRSMIFSPSTTTGSAIASNSSSKVANSSQSVTTTAP